MIKRLAMKLGLRWLGTQCREIAEGKQGPGPQKAYLWLIGKKRPIGLFLGCVTAALVALDQNTAVEFVTGTLAAAFLSGGFIDANWREVPKLDSVWLRILREHAMDVSALLGALSLAFAQCVPSTVALLSRLHLTCEQATAALVVLSAVLAHLGVSATAQASAPPALGVPGSGFPAPDPSGRPSDPSGRA